jgi:hypothetical protein
MKPSVRTCHDRCRDAWKRCQKKSDERLHELVLCGNDETARMRRRLHIHVCLLSLTGLVTLLAGMSLVNADIVVGSSVGINACQEFLDYVGRF